MRRLSRRWGPFLGGMIGAIVILVLGLLLFTQTTPGRERILKITLETLGGQLNGELLVERLEGGLFTGARLYDVTLRDPEARELITADSVFIEYQVVSFLRGDIIIDDLVVYDPEVLIYRFPGDSLWNYQAVLQDTTAGPEPEEPGRATVVRNLGLVDALVTIRLPWEPDEELTPQERASEIDAALSDTARLAVESVPGGYLRTIIVRTPQTTLEALTVASDERGGTYLRIAGAEAEIDLYRDEPLRLRELEGELSLSEGVLRYVAPRVRLPASQLASEGVLDLSGEEPLYDVRVNGREVALRDVQWLYPAFPEQGEASFDMEIETRRDNLFVRATNLSLAAPGTRLVGEFALLMGDSLLFSDVSLRADPLDMDTVEEMLPGAIPVRGLQIGAFEVQSPAS